MKRIFASCVSLLCALFVTQAQTKWFVAPGAPAGGAGTAWATPRDLQTAINNASAGDSVFVVQGMYQLATGQSFTMKEGVKIYGRFAGTEIFLSERNLKVTYASTLSGNKASVILNNGNGLSSAAVLDGFTITNGNYVMGGGMYNNGASPTISNCIFTKDTGCAIYNTSNAATISNCVFTNNLSNSLTARAGAITNTNVAGASIVNCIVYGNKDMRPGL